MKFVLFVTLIWSILDSGWSITDEDLMRLEAGLTQIQALSGEVHGLKNENVDLRNEHRAGLKHIQILTSDMAELKSANRQMEMKNGQLLLRVDHLEQELNQGVGHLDKRVGRLEETCEVDVDLDFAQNATIEERVTFLEVQMTEVQSDVLDIKVDVDFLFAEQVIQDERIYDLEQDTEDLDSRVEVLEANGGGGGNVTALEERVETLEGTAAQHEADIDDLETATSSLDGRVESLEGEISELDTRLTSAEAIIEDLDNDTSSLDGRVEILESETSDLETRLTAAEALIEDLQATDIELDSRISDLEEGGGGASNETIAFHAVMSDADNDNIPGASIIIFSEVQVNEGNGYDPATGVFTVPSGGEGYYYFASHFTVDYDDYVYIDLRVNDVTVCSIHDNNGSIDTYQSSAGCSAVVSLVDGDEVENVYRTGSSTFTPLYEGSPGFYNGFTGFKI